MTTMLGIICGLLAILVFRMSIQLKKSFRDGFEHGYESGKLDGDNWWLGVEAEVKAERQKIWGEEAQC